MEQNLDLKGVMRVVWGWGTFLVKRIAWVKRTA